MRKYILKIKKNLENYFTLTKLFLLPMINSKFSTILNVVLLPSIMIVFFKLFFGDSANEKLQYILTGSLIIGVISTSLSTLSVKVNNLVVSNGMEYFLSFPINKFEFILSLISAELIVFLPSSYIVLFFGRHILGINNYVNLTLLSLFLILLSISLIGIGTLIGYKAKNYNQTISISSLVSYALIFLSPIYYSIDSLNIFLRIPSYLIPSTYAANMIRKILYNSGNISYNDVFYNLMIMIIFSIISMAILLKLFRWSLND